MHSKPPLYSDVAAALARAKIDELFPTDGVYAVENPDRENVVHRIVRIRASVVHDGRFPPEHKHGYFSFFELHADDAFAGIKAVRLDTFTNR